MDLEAVTPCASLCKSRARTNHNHFTTCFRLVACPSTLHSQDLQDSNIQVFTQRPAFLGRPPIRANLRWTDLTA
eukprot:293069-Amphidinium_carterae.1